MSDRIALKDGVPPVVLETIASLLRERQYRERGMRAIRIHLEAVAEARKV